MKVLVIGDSHGNIANLKHVLGFGKKIGVVAVVHTGDWNNMDAIETVYSYDLPVYGVLGNADIEPVIKSKLKDFMEFEIDNKQIGVVHKIHDGYKLFSKNLDIIFVGHYHSQSESKYKRPNGVYYRVVRPGALENGINFAVYDTSKNKVEFIHE